jgi:hypothetical protein
MQKGDISNQMPTVLAFDVEDILVPDPKIKRGWFSLQMYKLTKGWWEVISPTYQLAPGALRTLNALHESNVAIHLILLGKYNLSRYALDKIFDSYNIPFTEFSMCDDFAKLKEYLLDIQAKAFFSTQPERYYSVGYLGVPITTWAELRIPNRT